MSIAIITGGAGFVASHLLDLLLKEESYDKIIILDLVQPGDRYDRSSDLIHYIKADVRLPIDPEPFRKLGCGSDTVIYNLAAICRIPGFPDVDYYHTNIYGAENVCELANELSIRKMIFTSSVSPYGASEELKKEDSVPQPKDPYGGSKLCAEYIHKGWQKLDEENRMLTILRPGIIFGKGENANFTRLYESLKKGFFVYPGRKDTRKACVYVKDIARACLYFSEANPGIKTYNTVYTEAPTIEEICLTVAGETDAKKPFMLIPGPILVFVAYCILLLGKIIGKEFTGIHPDRVKKVMISTNISGAKLAKTEFEMSYPLKEAIRDWYEDCKNEGLC